jgi:hypothetical protein
MKEFLETTNRILGRIILAKENNCVCLGCGEEFYVKNCLKGVRKFCGLDCWYKYVKETHVKVEHIPNTFCLNCNKHFFLYPSQIKLSKKHFCSEECFKKYQEKVREGDLVCLNCGNNFYASLSVIKRNGGKYCSRQCFYESIKTENNCKCECCGKEFYSKPSKFLTGRGKFCSNQCRNFLQVGENHPAWRGGISFGKYCQLFNDKFKEKIRNRFGRKCFLCGKDQDEMCRKLSIHHIDYFKASICRGKDWAFVPLCGSCHGKTNYNRHYWFSLLINYWLSNPEIHLNESYAI